MRIVIAAVLIAILSACSPEPDLVRVETEPHCVTEQDRATLAAFIVDCAKAANPLSDEEGEDLVKQCERTGIRTVCPEHEHRKVYSPANYTWTTTELSKEPKP
jgi:hypothetical protein